MREKEMSRVDTKKSGTENAKRERERESNAKIE